MASQVLPRVVVGGDAFDAVVVAEGVAEAVEVVNGDDAAGFGPTFAEEEELFAVAEVLEAGAGEGFGAVGFGVVES